MIFQNKFSLKIRVEKHVLFSKKVICKLLYKSTISPFYEQNNPVYEKS